MNVFKNPLLTFKVGAKANVESAERRTRSADFIMGRK
jgi:hypothetical protein